MKILLIGGGGREHALAWKLSADSARPDIFCAPGNAGTAGLGVNLSLPAEDVDGLLAWAQQERPELTVVGPEAPLCAGLADRFRSAKLPVFGPCHAAAQLEGSKIFSKDVMRRAGVPTAESAGFTDMEKALAHVRRLGAPLVVKADGLAAGKGVTVCARVEEAENAVREALVEGIFGDAGRKVLIEEFLEGEELSVLALVDGTHVALLPSAQDHKRIFDHDQGPNTGGMGAYSPASLDRAAMLDKVREDVFNRTLWELRRRDIAYCGVLYAGLMIGRTGTKVLEFNCRFGDPETQAVLPRLKGDLIPLLEACINGDLADKAVECRPEPCVCVVMAAGGYPGAYRKGDEIVGIGEADRLADVKVFHAGTRADDRRVVTAGGRVLGVSALGADLRGAVSRVYEAVSRISFRDAFYRRDIAARGLRRHR